MKPFILNLMPAHYAGLAVCCGEAGPEYGVVPDSLCKFEVVGGL